MNILRSALGYYESRGKPELIDVVIGHSFGTLTGSGSVNHSLAKFILDHNKGWPIVADRMLADAFPRGDEDVAHVVEGPITNTVGQGVGTWGTLMEAQEYMKENHLYRPLMVAQSHHIGRVVMQARKLGMKPVVPPGLPSHFDAASEQRWTRSLGWWVPREVLGSVMLRAQHKL